MNKKFIILLLVVFFISIAVASAAGVNDTAVSSSDGGDELSQTDGDKLDKTYYYDGNGHEYEDDTVITHNVVKYYGDKDKKFAVKVLDDDGNPEKDVEVSFYNVYKGYKYKSTNSKGMVYFAINYNVGTYDVETTIDSEDGNGFWSAWNTVKIKSTIPTKELVKFSGSSKKFKIKFLDTKGNVLKGKAVKLAVNGRTYKLKTDNKGTVKIKSNFKIGKHKITAYNPVSGEKRKISVVVLKKGVHNVNIRIDNPTVYFPVKRLSNGDRVETVYETQYRQYNPGVYVQVFGSSGLSDAKHTKLIKAKFFFKNKKTGKVITKTSSKVKYNGISIKPIKGYSPYKASVWYRDKY